MKKLFMMMDLKRMISMMCVYMMLNLCFGLKVEAAISLNQVSQYTNIYDTSKSNEEEFQYEIHGFETSSSGIVIGGWAVIPYSQHLSGSSTHEVAIYLSGSDSSKKIYNQSYTNNYDNVSRTDHFRLNGVNTRCGDGQYNQSQNTCYYDYNRVGFEVLIPYDDLKPGVNYDVYILMNTKTTGKKYMSPVYAMNINGSKNGTSSKYGLVSYYFKSELRDSTVKMLGDPVYVRSTGSKTGSVKTYNGKNLYWRVGETYSNIKSYSVENQSSWNPYDKVLWWNLGYVKGNHPTENSRLRVINGTTDSGYTANTWTELGGKQAQIQVTYQGSWTFSGSQVSLTSGGTLNLSGSHYHTNWNVSGTVNQSMTKLINVSTNATKNYSDSSRNGNSFSLNTDVKNLDIGKYRIEHYTSYSNTPSNATNTSNQAKVNLNSDTGWVIFANGKKGKVAYDSSQGALVLEIAKSEANWQYGLHTNSPTGMSTTNTGGMAVIEQNNNNITQNKLFIYGYHQDTNRFGMTPSEYKLDIYKVSDSGSWSFIKSVNDLFSLSSTDTSFKSLINLDDFENGKYKFNHVATIDGNQHIFTLGKSNISTTTINTEWFTIGEGRTDDLGKRMARIYMDSSNELVLEIKTVKGIEKLNSITYQSNSIDLSTYLTIQGNNGESIKNMYNANNIFNQKILIKNAQTGNAERSIDKSSIFDGWGVNFSIKHEWISQLPLGTYYLEARLQLDSGDGATRSHGAVDLTSNGKDIEKTIFIEDKKVTVTTGTNNRIELVVEPGIDLVAEKIEAYTSNLKSDGLVQVTINSVRELPYNVKAKIELSYNGSLANTITVELTKNNLGKAIDVTIPKSKLVQASTKQIEAKVTLLDNQDSDISNNTIISDFYTSSTKTITLSHDSHTDKVTYKGVIKTERIRNEAIKLFYETITLTRSLPKKEMVTYASFPLTLTIDYQNELNRELMVKNAQSFMPLELLDNYLSYPMVNNTYQVEMESTSTKNQQIFKFPTIYYEKQTGLLFNSSTDSRITSSVRPTNDWFIPLNAPIQTYQFSTTINEVGTNEITLMIVNEIEVTKHFVANTDPSDSTTGGANNSGGSNGGTVDSGSSGGGGWNDGKVYIRIIDPTNPFPSGKIPDRWKDLLDFFQ